MSELPKLYGYDSKKRVKEWSVLTNGDEITVSHGLMGGKIQSKTTKVKGKNIGRANETTPEEQAIKEAQSKWNKQKDKSYCENPMHIVAQKNPMLANPYKTFDGPYWVQPKLDGVRAILQWADSKSSKIELKSRGGKSYPVPEHLEDELRAALILNEGTPLDGELYIHGEPLNRIVSAAKKPNELTPQLKFCVFDSCDESIRFSNRFSDMIDDVFVRGAVEFKHVELVDAAFITEEASVSKLHDEYVRMGYEGLILRKPRGMYKFDHRSPDLLKYKEFKDAEWEIVDVVPDKDGLGKIICHCPESTDPKDKTFGVTLGSHEEKKWQLENKWKIIGKGLTVKYQAMTKYNKPQFGVGVCIREGEFVSGEFVPHE